MKNWNNGDIMFEADYEKERSVIITAINANDDQIKAVDAKHDGNTTELDAKIDEKDTAMRTYVDNKKVKTDDILPEAVTPDKIAPGIREDRIELDYPTSQVAQRLAQLEANPAGIPEVQAARGGYPSLAARLDALSPTFSMPEYKTTATAGQTVFDVSSVGQFAVGQKRILSFLIDGYQQSNYTETSSTKLTIASPCEGGEQVFIKFIQGDYLPMTSGHGRAHRKGGVDAININDLEGADDFAVRFDRDVNVKAYGAKGDGVTDDTAAIQAAINACGNKRRVYFPNGTYVVKSTLDGSPCCGFVGEQGGVTLLWLPTDRTTDLLPCVRIQSNPNTVLSLYENITIASDVPYSAATLGTYITKSYFDTSDYRMFAVGSVAFGVSGKAKPVFRNCSTRNVKVGLHLDADDGHITSYDCNWSGLIGVYVSKNAWDYFFQGGGIQGIFTGILLGCKMYVGYSGGMGATMTRVHLGYSAYGIYQCIDDLANYNAQQYVGGLIGVYTTVRFEQIGEAAIKMLPKSRTDGTTFTGFGMSWSIQGSPEDYTIPAAILPDNQKQNYGAYFGYLSNSKFGQLDAGPVLKSSRANALGNTYIAFYDGGDSDLTGLGSVIQYGDKNPAAKISSATLSGMLGGLNAKIWNAMTAGNLIDDPERASSWHTYNSATFQEIPGSSLPDWQGSEPQKVLGDNVIGIKVTPNGTDSPNIYIEFPDVPTPVGTTRPLNFEYYIYCPQFKSIRSRISLGNWAYLYDYSFELASATWRKVSNVDGVPSDTMAYNANIFELHPSQPTYIVGVMVSQGVPGPYARFKYPYTSEAVGADKGVIVKDLNLDKKAMIYFDQGQLKTRDWSDADGIGTVHAPMTRMLQGSYTGDAAAGTRTISLPGVTPKFIYIAGYTSAGNSITAIWMANAFVHMAQGLASGGSRTGPTQTGTMVPNGITNGFTVQGTSPGDLNAAASTYYYTILY
jgi:hypothetical protein